MKPVLQHPNLDVYCGDALDVLSKLPDESVQCCVTSPPYWGLRDYGVEGQLGLEKTPQEFVAKMVAVFAEVRRVLKKDGTAWVNLGDSYATGTTADRKQSKNPGVGANCPEAQNSVPRVGTPHGCKTKDLVGIPWMVAFALRADGWYLRSEITWCKKAPMPESVTDRPTSATEKVFLLSKSDHYYYNAEAVRTPPSEAMLKQVAEGYNGEALKGFETNGVQNASSVKARIINGARKRIDKQSGHSRRHAGFNDRWNNLTKAEQMACGANMRNYWLLGPEPFLEEHFAAYPPDLIKPCILAGSRVGDVVLDPFAGSGTTGQVALELGRKALLIELNPDYIKLIEKRTYVTPGLPL